MDQDLLFKCPETPLRFCGSPEQQTDPPDVCQGTAGQKLDGSARSDHMFDELVDGVLHHRDVGRVH